MVPSFVPIIGSGPNAFSDIGQQQQAWAGFSQRQDQDNLNRLAQAQQTHNNWLARVADMQAADVARADNLDAEAARNARIEGDRLRSDAEQQRQFGISTDLTKRGQDIQEGRYTAADKERQRLEKESQDAAMNFAQAKADQVAKYGAEHDKAQQQVNDAMAELARTKADAERSLPRGVVFNSALRQWQPGQLLALDDKGRAALDRANTEFAAAEAGVMRAQQEHNEHIKNFQQLQNEVAKWGLTTTADDKGWHIIHPTTGKIYRGVQKDAAPLEQHIPVMGRFQVSEAAAATAPTEPISARFTQPTPVAPSPTPLPPSLAPSIPGVKRVVRGPDGRYILAPVGVAPAPQVQATAPYQFSGWGD